MVACDRCHRKFATYAALRQHYANQHPNAKWPEAFENKLVDERGLQTYKATLRPTKSSHTKLIVAIVLIVLVVGGGWYYISASSASSPGSTNCASFPFPPIGNQDLAEHYHALILIYVNGQQINVPANVGEGDSGPCTQPLHVHADSSGTNVIHIETPQERTYSVGDFFKVWAATPNVGGPTPVVFNQNQLFNYTTSSGYELRMYVNGQQSTAFNSLVLESHMVIVIVYGNSGTDWSYYQNQSAQPWPYANL
jgi:hypothetical protein